MDVHWKMWKVIIYNFIENIPDLAIANCWYGNSIFIFKEQYFLLFFFWSNIWWLNEVYYLYCESKFKKRHSTILNLCKAVFILGTYKPVKHSHVGFGILNLANYRFSFLYVSLLAPNFKLKPQGLSGTHIKLMLFPCFKLAAT